MFPYPSCVLQCSHKPTLRMSFALATHPVPATELTCPEPPGLSTPLVVCLPVDRCRHAGHVSLQSYWVHVALHWLNGFSPAPAPPAQPCSRILNTTHNFPNPCLPLSNGGPAHMHRAARMRGPGP
eukprot:12376715-Alexandrium_andersonii.AAC.1